MKDSGFNPKAGLDLYYRFNETISMGFEYEYYRNIGNNTALIDFDQLSIGNLTGAFTIIPSKISVNVYSLRLRFSF